MVAQRSFIGLISHPFVDKSSTCTSGSVWSLSLTSLLVRMGLLAGTSTLVLREDLSWNRRRAEGLLGYPRIIHLLAVCRSLQVLPSRRPISIPRRTADPPTSLARGGRDVGLHPSTLCSLKRCWRHLVLPGLTRCVAPACTDEDSSPLTIAVFQELASETRY